ncbi:hypothetical protein [Coleofasciculus sp. FACHB-SPT9]|uniref:hypothetical protein n=2 Tax=Cyanobacteriota TaxID=1117 RepID=UPI00168541A0|nr:hypothetical protein [Coleofasciculus sp. FACHB-SPT9]
MQAMSQDTLNLIRDRQNRGYTKLGWLDSDRTFSLGGLLDPEPMRFCTLRLIHEDRVLTQFWFRCPQPS